MLALLTAKTASPCQNSSLTCREYVSRSYVSLSKYTQHMHIASTLASRSSKAAHPDLDLSCACRTHTPVQASHSLASDARAVVTDTEAEVAREQNDRVRTRIVISPDNAK